MGKLVLLGGGHAHLTVMSNLHHLIKKGHQTVVVGASPHYYSGMGPGMLGGYYRPDEISFNVKAMVENREAEFIDAKAVRINPHNRTVELDSGQTLEYDVLSCNTGSSVPELFGIEDGAEVFTVKPIRELLRGRDLVLERAGKHRLDIAVVGGGPGALEVAGNVHHLALTRAEAAGKPAPRVTVFAGKRFLRGLPERVRRIAANSLKGRGVVINEEGYVAQASPTSVTLENGDVHRADVLFLAPGIKPSPLFRDSNLPVGPDGGLLVNEYLQSPEHPNIFGGGDCIHFSPHPLDKVGVYAVRQNPILDHNLAAALEGEPLKEFDPGGDDYLLIFNLGDGTGIFRKSIVTFDGRLAFWLKDRIDRAFMKKFQNMERITS